MNRIRIFNLLPGIFRAGIAALLVCLCGYAQAVITGTMGEDPSAANGNARTFTLTARHDFISTADGNSHYAWGYAHSVDFPMQYPGPTLIVNQGDTVKIVLNNALPVAVSMIFPGLQGVSSSGGNAGLLTREVRAVTAAELAAKAVVGSVTYTFVADKPGTFLYHSGTNPDLQVEMGLVGALIVRPTGFNKDAPATWKAYAQVGTNFDREHLFLLTEMDPAIHWQIYAQVFGNQPIGVDTTTIKPTVWFINGRGAPDTLLDEYVEWLPTQPYNALPRMHPGERLLMRVVNAGRDLHPFHHHGNHATPIARDAQVLSSAPADLTKAPDLTSPDFTVRAVPGQTMDLIYEWTGKNIGWDIYGTVAENPHTCVADANGFYTNGVSKDPSASNFAKNYGEFCGDHDKAIPVTIPSQLDISYGESYSGSPFLGMTGSLPQGHPGLNTTGGYYHMWHSHNEKEVTNDNIFPGGMMTMLVIEPWTVDLGYVTASIPGGPGGGGGGGGGDPNAIPTVTVLDNFNRANANMLNNGTNWQQLVVLANSGIRVNSNQAFCINTGLQAVLCAAGANAYWNATAFGAKQAAAFTFANTTLNGGSLWLKASGTLNAAGVYTSGVRVRYSTGGGGQVIVQTTANSGGLYTTIGTLPATFANGDKLTAQANSDGSVQVWKTTAANVTTYLGKSATSLFVGNGRVGMQLPSGARVDDFSAANVP